MFKECTTKLGVEGAGAPASSAVVRLATLVSARNLLAAISLILIGTTATWTPAVAALHAVCIKSHRACLQGCDKKWVSPEFRRACYSRCEENLRHCSDITSGAPPKNAPTEPDKNPPKSTGGHTLPTGGTKDEPKPPPKVNDTRPPIGGGIFQRSDSGTSAPILKSNDRGGPSFRSNGQRWREPLAISTAPVST